MKSLTAKAPRCQVEYSNHLKQFRYSCESKTPYTSFLRKQESFSIMPEIPAVAGMTVYFYQVGD